MKEFLIFLFLLASGCTTIQTCTNPKTSNTSNLVTPSPIPPLAFLADTECNRNIVSSPISIQLPRELHGKILPGWTWLSFDITKEGNTENIKIISSSEGGTYDEASVMTLKDIRYKTSENGIKNCKLAFDYSTYYSK